MGGLVIFVGLILAGACSGVVQVGRKANSGYTPLAMKIARAGRLLGVIVAGSGLFMLVPNALLSGLVVAVVLVLALTFGH